MCDDDGKINEPVTQQAQPATLNKERTSSNNNSTLDPPTAVEIENWLPDDVHHWAGHTAKFSESLADCLRQEGIDGLVLLSLTENDIRDLRHKMDYMITLGEMKKFWLTVCHLQQQWKNEQQKDQLPLNCSPKNKSIAPLLLGIASHGNVFMPLRVTEPWESTHPEDPCYIADCETYKKIDKRMIAPEYFKTAISLGYSFVVTWITSFVMVIVHERVPDMKRYPPLPDIFLDNVPHIPWAFNMCEITGSLLFSVWLIVLIFHKYRMVLLRRFFALAGTVFLLRCVTMLITSLSVPGTHLQCNQKDFAIDDPNVDMVGALIIRMTRAYRIWSGLGMSIQGVRTCGDYMFSGHTVALTLLNFFITEYTPRNLYFLHTMTWLLNMFGIFFILAAHEHYSIDVFVAFYITSRLFLYYHTLANNRALMQSDSTRTRIWFPMFSYFENHVDGIIPNEFETLGSLIDSLINCIIWAKDEVFMRVYRYSVSKAASKLFSPNAMPQVFNRTHAVGSNYLSPHDSMVGNANTRLASTRATTDLTRDTHSSSPAGPEQRRRATTTMVDASVSPLTRASSVKNNESRSPTIKEKKHL